MRTVDVIRRKRDGGTLRRREIEYFVAGVTDGTIPDYQAAALLMGSILIILAGCATTAEGPEAYTVSPEPALPLTAEALEPGLSVQYFEHRFVRHLDRLPPSDKFREKGWSGPPIPYLNHQFGRGEIFDSGTNRGIAMEIDGFIRLDRPGTYSFQANTNDGFRLLVSGQRLIDDPSWHSDRLSPAARLVVTDPGWYALHIRYFQRKGTATLQLYWKPPQDESFSIVPARVLAHRAS